MRFRLQNNSNFLSKVNRVSFLQKNVIKNVCWFLFNCTATCWLNNQINQPINLKGQTLDFSVILLMDYRASNITVTYSMAKQYTKVNIIITRVLCCANKCWTIRPQDISPPWQLATSSRQLAPKLGQLPLSQDNSPPMIYLIHNIVKYIVRFRICIH